MWMLAVVSQGDPLKDLSAVGVTATDRQTDSSEICHGFVWRICQGAASLPRNS